MNLNQYPAYIQWALFIAISAIGATAYVLFLEPWLFKRKVIAFSNDERIRLMAHLHNLAENLGNRIQEPKSRLTDDDVFETYYVIKDTYRLRDQKGNVMIDKMNGKQQTALCLQEPKAITAFYELEKAAKRYDKFKARCLSSHNT